MYEFTQLDVQSLEKRSLTSKVLHFLQETQEYIVSRDE